MRFSLASLVWILLSVVAIADKPTIYFVPFKADWCGPCKQFNLDCQHDRRMLKAIRSRFIAADAIDVEVRGDLAKRYGINRVPTFLLIDQSGLEVGRITGYDGPKIFLEELANVQIAKRPILTPPVTSPPPQQQPRDDPTAEILRANEALQEALEQTRSAKKQSDAEAERHRRRVQALEELRDRLQAEAIAERERLLRPAAPEFSPEDRIAQIFRSIPEPAKPEAPPTEKPVLPPVAPTAKKRGFLQSVFHHGVQVALSAGLTAAQSEVIVPLVAGVGPIGIAGVVGWQLLKAMRRRKRGVVVEPQANFPPEARADANLPLPRKLDEARELLRLRQQEGRHAIHDGLFGALADAELEKLVESGDTTALRLRDTLQRRMNDIAPLSTT